MLRRLVLLERREPCTTCWVPVSSALGSANTARGCGLATAGRCICPSWMAELQFRYPSRSITPIPSCLTFVVLQAMYLIDHSIYLWLQDLTSPSSTLHPLPQEASSGTMSSDAQFSSVRCRLLTCGSRLCASTYPSSIERHIRKSYTSALGFEVDLSRVQTRQRSTVVHPHVLLMAEPCRTMISTTTTSYTPFDALATSAGALHQASRSPSLPLADLADIFQKASRCCMLFLSSSSRYLGRKTSPQDYAGIDVTGG